MKVYTICPGKIYQRGKFLKYPLAEKLAFMRQHDIGVVVNMTNNVDRELRDCGKVTYVEAGIPDSGRADFALVERCIEVAIGLHTAHRCAILVHCNAGRNRSSLFSARLLMELEGLTGAQAIKELRRLRPNALANSAFCRYLTRRETSHRDTTNKGARGTNKVLCESSRVHKP